MMIKRKTHRLVHMLVLDLFYTSNAPCSVTARVSKDSAACRVVDEDELSLSEIREKSTFSNHGLHSRLIEE